MSCKILNNTSINDNEFLKLMIVHHQAALGMSYSVLKTSRNDIILDFARKIIINQSYEVDYMKSLLSNIKKLKVNTQTYNEPLPNLFKIYYPDIYKNLTCNESHFNFHPHNMSDSLYVEHMIAHHNTALLLSKLIIRSTSNQQILALAQIITLDQAKEIFYLSTLLKSIKTSWQNKVNNLYSLI
jgi:uncharacterized protein (DUF305 family)